MKKFDIGFKTKLYLEQARSESRTRELEMHIKKTEINQQLVENERELQRKLKRTALESDDVRPQ